MGKKTRSRDDKLTATGRVMRCIDLSGAVHCVALAVAKLAGKEQTAEDALAWKPTADTPADHREAFEALKRAGSALMRLIDAQQIPYYRETTEETLRNTRYARNVNTILTITEPSTSPQPEGERQ